MADPRDLLPPGFQIEAPTDPMASLPAGFQIEQPTDSGSSPGRLANAATQGITNAIAEAIGYPADLVASGVRRIGGPAPQDPSFYANAIKGGLRAVGQGATKLISALPGGQAITAPAGGPPEAQNALERGVYGAGHGAGDVASMLLPSQVIANTAKAGTLTSNVAKAMTTSPGMQVASAAAGEGVGQATENPWLGLATSLAIPAGAMAASRMRAAKAASAAIPTTEELANAAKAAYKASENADVVISQPSFQGFVGNLKTTLANEGVSKRLHPGIIGALSDIEDAAANNITLKGVDLLRQNLTDIAAASTAPGERRLAGVMREQLDDYLSKLDPKDVIMGDAKTGVDQLETARDAWRTMRKSAVVDDLLQRADLSASNFSASGKENAIRTEFRNLAKNEKKMRQFTPDEQDMIRKVATGGPVANALRYLGKLAPRGVVSGTADVILGGHLGPLGPLMVMGAGEAGRQAATASTMGRVNSLSELIRSGGASARASKQPLLTDQSAALLARILAQSANPNSLSNPLLLQPQ